MSTAEEREVWVRFASAIAGRFFHPDKDYKQVKEDPDLANDVGLIADVLLAEYHKRYLKEQP